MKNLLRRLKASQAGSAMVEFAIIAPVFFALLVGILQLGMVMYANGILKHAVGDAARKATLFPVPSDAQIKSGLNARDMGLEAEYLGTPAISRGTLDGRDYVEVSISYTYPLNFIITRQTVPLVETRRVFVQAT